MSTFEVKVRKITVIEPHNNADRLELVSIGGYRAVVQKGIHKIGDLVVYIPNDSIIPDETSEALRIKDYLVGKNKNRVKALRLRGEVSQGIVIPLHVIFDYLEVIMKVVPDETDFVEDLGITKYEEPVPVHMQGVIRPWPSYLSKYDIENVNKPEALHLLEGKEVVVTEKLHGTNMSVSMGMVDGVWEHHVCSRNLSLEEDENNLYWKAADKYMLIPHIRNMIASITVELKEITELTIRGEVVGVQDLKYGFNGGNPGFFVFDIRVNGNYLPWVQMLELCETYQIDVVPFVYQGVYDYNLFKELSQDPSDIDGGVREGIVVKPVHGDEYVHNFGRVIVKFINEDYLTRKDGTEHH